MRSGATQASPTAHPDMSITVGGDTFYTKIVSDIPAKLLKAKEMELIWGGKYEYWIDNSDGSLNSADYKGKELTAYHGFIGTTGSDLPPIWVDDQRFESYAGRLVLHLVCYDAMALLAKVTGAFSGAFWNYPWQDPDALTEYTFPDSQQPLSSDMITKISSHWNKTVRDIVGTTISEAFNAKGIELATGDDGDSYMSAEKPQVAALDARNILLQAMGVTESYLLFKSDGDFHVVRPQSHASVYTYNLGTYHKSTVAELAVAIPNRAIYWFIDKVDPEDSSTWIWEHSDYGTGHGVDSESYTRLGFYIDEHHNTEQELWEAIANQTEADNRADARIAKIKLGKATGQIVAPMHCAQELFDAVTIYDDRYSPTREITGYVFGILREYDRGVYQITLDLGGVETGMTPGGGEPIHPTSPVTKSRPPRRWNYVIPPGQLAYIASVDFSPVDWDTVQWTSGSIVLSDGRTQSINAGSLDMTTGNTYYIYCTWGSSTLSSTTSATEAITDQRLLVAVAKRASTTDQMAYVFNPYSSDILINRDGVMDDLITELQLADDAVTNAKIAVNAIYGDVIAAAAITAPKIDTGAITEAKVATGAITNTKIDTGAITEAKIAAGAVTNTKIGTDAVSSAKILAGAVIAGKIAAGAVLTENLDALAVTADKIAANAITTVKIDALAVNASKIAASAIITEKLDALAVTAAKIAAGAIESEKIAAAAVTAGKLAAGSVITEKLDALAVTAEKIAASAVTSEKIYAGAVTAIKIDVSQLSAISANCGTLTSGTINGATIYAGGGNVVLDADGISIYGENLYFDNGINDVGFIKGNSGDDLEISTAIGDGADILFNAAVDFMVGAAHGVCIHSGGYTIPSVGLDDILLDSDDYIYLYADDQIDLTALTDIDINPGATYSCTVDGDFDVTGTKNCRMILEDGRKFLFAAIESPELWFEEKLSGRTSGGVCVVSLDERFTACILVSEQYPLHAIVTPTSDCGNVWVEKFIDSVTVHSERDGSFDIVISAKRKGYETIRFDEMVHDEELDKDYKLSKQEEWLRLKPERLVWKSQRAAKLEAFEKEKAQREEVRRTRPNVGHSRRFRLVVD